MADLIFLCSSTVTRTMSSLISRASGIDTRVRKLVCEGRELKATWDEVERAVAAAELQQWVPRAVVKRWLERADGVLKDVDAFEDAYWNWRDQFHGFFGFLLSCGCPLFCGYALGARAADLLVQLQELRAQKIELDDVARPPPFVPVEKIPAPTNPMISYRDIMEEIWRCLRDDTVRVIGICGMGGTGKSTLLTTINNDANDLIGKGGSDGFDVVIWVDMSTDISVERLRRKVAKRCCLLPHQVGDDINLPHLLFNFLSNRRFLLLLSDMWRALDLAEVGVPVPDPENKSKIVFTTRSDYVYTDMETDKRIVVEPLNERDSWELFRTKVPGELLDSDPSIREHAEALVAACGGLAIAISRLGRTMAHKKRRSEWAWACKMILESPTELRGMNEVINLMKESFDRLSGDLARRCLIHCSSVFRDRHEIGVEELVDSLVTGGLLCDEDRGKGYDVIEDLKALFLLQTCGDGHDQVKLHPMVRITALHIAKQVEGVNP